MNASLRKLQTDYIDLVGGWGGLPLGSCGFVLCARADQLTNKQLYVHWWDYSTGIPELMQSLNQLVAAGKVLYLGISDTPAWVVSKANEYARNHGLRQFSVYQGRWSAASRDFERDILPMARDEGMALAPWGALGGGAFKTEEQRRSQQGRAAPASPEQIAISRVLEVVAARRDTLITSVALAYVLHKSPYVFPIVGGRTVGHLRANIDALRLRLDDDDIAQIEAAVPFDKGFPHSFIWTAKGHQHPQDNWLTSIGGIYDYVPLPRPIAIPDDPAGATAE